MLTRFKSSVVPALVWTLFITILLCFPGKEFPQITWLNKIWIDKWVHVFLFLVLVFIWNRSFIYKNFTKERILKLFYRITFLSIVYGIMMEIIQHYFIPFRSFEITDIIADAIGSLSGYLITARVYKKN